MRTNWKFLRLAALALVVSVVAACGDSGVKGPADSTGGPSGTENQTNPVPRAQLRDGGTFTWPLEQMPVTYNWNHLDGSLKQGFYVMAALMPTTYTTDATGTPIWNRDLLASEPTLVSEPKQVVTYQINPKAVWYDGTPITWEDFYWHWKANNGSDPLFQLSSSSGYEEMESVAKGNDEREVVVTYRGVYSAWPAMFNQFYPASTNKDHKVFNEGWKSAILTTAGPFKVASINQTSKTIILVRNEKWWGDRALLDTIVFRAIEPDAHVEAAANGEVDAVDIGPDADKYSRAKGIAEMDFRTAGAPAFRHVTLNGTSPILQDVRVRQAVAMGIDRGMLVKAMLTPLEMTAAPLNNHLFMATQVGYRNNAGAIGEFNPAKAAELLDAAGWKLDGEIRKKGGKSLELDLLIPGGVATSRQEAELIQNMLGKIGVAVQIRTLSRDILFDKYITPGQYDLAIFVWSGTAYPVATAKGIYATPQKDSTGQLIVRQNYARIGSREIDSLFAVAVAQLDRGKAIELGNRIDSLIWQEVHSITTYQRPEIILVKKKLANFGAFGFAAPWVYQDIGWMK